MGFNSGFKGLKSFSYIHPPTSFGPENPPMHFKIYINLTTMATVKDYHWYTY